MYKTELRITSVDDLSGSQLSLIAASDSDVHEGIDSSDPNRCNLESVAVVVDAT